MTKQLLFSPDVIQSCHSSQLNPFSNCKKHYEQHSWIHYMILCQACIRVHALVIPTSTTVSKALLTSKGLELLTKSVCAYVMWNIIKTMSTHCLVYIHTLTSSHFPTPFMILLYFKSSSVESIEVWKHRTLAPTVPIAHVEGDCKMQEKDNIVNVQMFHSHMSRGKCRK